MLDSAGGSMDSCSENTVDGPIRSRFRGLSWDKKHQGWRVRIYWAGKQRHVGRYEDDVAAAKAYDKSAFYLYGANAITNFGLEACMSDPTEVSPFIVLAKEQAELDQSKFRSVRVATSLISQEMLQLKGQQLVQEPFMQPQLSLQQQQQQQPYARQHQPPASALAYAANHAAFQAHRLQQHQQQQLMGSTSQLQQQMVMLPSQAASIDTSSSMSCMTCAVASPSIAVAATAISEPPSNPPGGYVLCTTPAGQQVLLQLQQNGCAVQQQLLLQQQQQVQQQQQQAMLFANSNNCQQPLQLSVPPQLTTIAGHVSAAAAAQKTTLQQPQQQWQLPLQDLVMSLPMAVTASGAECSLPVAPVAAQTAAAAAAALATATSMSLSLQARSRAGCTPEPSGLLDSFHGYSSTTASPAGDRPGTVDNFIQQQQHAAALLSHCAATGNVFASEAGCSSCSPMTAAPTAVLEPASFQGIAAALSNQQQSAGSRQSMSVLESLGMNVTAHHLSASPTFSCSSSRSSNSRNFAGTMQMLH